MKKAVALLVALSLVTSPTLASASFQYDDEVLIVKKGGNGNGGGNGNKKVDKAASKLDKTAIKEERKRIIEEFKNDKEELKARAKEMRKQAKLVDKTTEEKGELLETTAELLEEAGELDEAIEVQEEAVKEDLQNIDRYKKLAQLMEKKGNKNIKAFINGKHPKFDVPPVIKSGRTLVPIRAISESLGAIVTWNEKEKTVLIEKDGIEIKLILDDVKAYVDGKEVKLDVPSSSINSRIVVPLRFISEAFDAAVEWEKETESVIIVDKDEEIKEDPTTEEPTTTGDTISFNFTNTPDAFLVAANK